VDKEISENSHKIAGIQEEHTNDLCQKKLAIAISLFYSVWSWSLSEQQLCLTVYLCVCVLAVMDRSAHLEDLSQRLAEVQDTLAEAHSALTKWEDKMVAHNSLGPAAKDPKHVDKIKVQ